MLRFRPLININNSKTNSPPICPLLANKAVQATSLRSVPDL
jgi:hypothetical protein